MNFDGSNVTLLVAFLGGIVTFFASCLLPLVPTYLAYLSGIALNDINRDEIPKRNIFINGLIFTIGFILVFVLLGATINIFGRTFATYKPTIQLLGGILFITLGLFMLGVIKPMTLLKEYKIDIRKKLTKWQKVNSFLIGMTFGFAWNPCIGPVLAVIYFWSSQADSFIKGVTLLIAYGIGLGIPFLIVALLFDKLAPNLKKAERFSRALQVVSGIIIIIVGILLIFGQTETLSMKLLYMLGFDSLSI